ncbi:MAG TPA: CoA ester lyase [Anaerolineales bacterium]|nr:CoA ester lyase [Anaerolineales bacterium]
MKPRRALLFMPGDDRRKIEKGIATKPDCVIMDMEDGVAANRKAEARAAIVAALNELDFGSAEKIVRINALDSGLAEADLAVVVPAKPDALLVPKIESPDQVAWVHRHIPDDLPLLIMIETAKAMVNLKEVAAAPGITALVFGAEDLIASVGGIRTRSNHEVQYARSAVAIYAAANGLQALDMVFVDLQDEAGLRAESRAALELGYVGKTAIHPRQIAPIIETFTPTAEEVDRAQRIVRAYNEQVASGTGAFAFEGKMVDMPIVRAAQAILARAGIT